jgi:hypothetical protein
VKTLLAAPSLIGRRLPTKSHLKFQQSLLQPRGLKWVRNALDVEDRFSSQSFFVRHPSRSNSDVIIFKSKKTAIQQHNVDLTIKIYADGSGKHGQVTGATIGSS